MREFRNRQKKAIKAPPAVLKQPPSTDLHSCSVSEDLLATAIYISDLSQRWVNVQSCGSWGFCHWEADSLRALSRYSCGMTRKNGAHMETLMIRGSKQARKDRLLSKHILITSITARLWAAAGEWQAAADREVRHWAGEGC